MPSRFSPRGFRSLVCRPTSACAPSLGISLLAAVALANPARAADHVVSTNNELQAALDIAKPGDRVLLTANGTFAGPISRNNLNGITLTSQNRANPATITGGNVGLRLGSPKDVTVSHLVFDAQTINSINFDDTGGTPGQNITIEHVRIQNLNPNGNHDAIKFSGINHFRLSQNVITSFGDAGSAFDLLGSHFGTIESNFIQNPHAGPGSRAFGPKGGAKDLRFQGNRIDLPVGRAIQFGGSTDPGLYRYVDGDSGYEAAHITAIGNVVTGSDSPANFVNISQGGRFAFNYAQFPNQRILRILNENPGEPIVDTANGQLLYNDFVYQDGLDQIVNAGNETDPGSFTFVGNRWFNVDGGPAGPGELNLPAPETDGTYGLDIRQDPDGAVQFADPEGDWLWLVNGNLAADTFTFEDLTNLQRAIPTPGGDGARFDPLADEAFVGDWTFAAVTDPTISVPAQSQLFFFLGGVGRLPGDANGDGIVSLADFLILREHFGSSDGVTFADGDFNEDGTVSLADFLILRANFGDSGDAPTPDALGASVPEPATLAVFPLAALLLRRTKEATPRGVAFNTRRNP